MSTAHLAYVRFYLSVDTAGRGILPSVTHHYPKAGKDVLYSRETFKKIFVPRRINDWHILKKLGEGPGVINWAEKS